MTPSSLRESSPTTRGRILATLYLLVIICGIVGQALISDRLVVSNDPGATAANILANTSLYRLAFTLFMIEQVAQIALSLLFYDLLKPVNKSLARITAVIGVAGSSIKAFARLFHYTPLLLLGGAVYLSSVEPGQLNSWSLTFIRINAVGAQIALIFFGFETLLRGWLIVKSEFLPAFLGVISMIGGAGWLCFLWPPLGSQLFMFIAVFAIVGVIATTGWLFIRGVDDAKWTQRATLAAASMWR